MPRLDDCDRDNPMRPTHWRWNRAQYLMEHNLRPSFRIDDPWVSTCLRFQRRLAAVDTEQARVELTQAGRHYYYAWLLWSERDELRRSILEARILARDSFEDIAAKHNMHIDTVRTYKAVFFNVLDSLQHQSYIVHTVLGHRYQVMRPGRVDWPILFRAIGFFYGADRLDEFIRGYQNEHRAESGNEVLNVLSDARRDAFWFKAFVAIFTLPVDGRTGPHIIRAVQRIEDLEREHGSRAVDSPAFKKGLETAVGELLSVVGGSNATARC